MLPWVVLISGLLTSACQSEQTFQPKELSGPTMGTQWRISLGKAHSGLTDVDHLQQEIEAELARINRLMSTWDPASELSQFNANPSTDAAAMHEHTVQVLSAALSVSESTQGAYDVTRGNVFALWGFSADTPQPNTPSEIDLNQALNNSGWQHVHVHNRKVSKAFPALSIDLSSLAKGFAVDRLGMLLQQNNIHHYVVNIGGEIESRGERSENMPWRIGIERPHQATADEEHELAGSVGENGLAESGLLLNDANLATSGSYRNVRLIDGRRVSHLIDGRTGAPIEHHLVAATVVHENTLLADAWSTAFMVAGPSWAKSYAQANALAVQLTELAEPVDGSFTLWKSPKWLELQAISAD